ncbi:MAG TPA: SCP2 sterol-binding domain-containing protein [Solirubrobacterales bacterium]|nr:SCP2 sterol-binding domain-containing protein [Solirubrobacterales bacterium]
MAENQMPIANVDLAQFEPEQFAELIAVATDEQISEVIHGPLRPRVLDEIFNRMADHVEPGQVANLDAVVHFKILDRPDEHGGGYDHYEVIFAEGTCRASDSPGRDPKVTIKLNGVHFLKLAANKASGPVLFMTGKLKLEGDVILASRLTSFFRIPSAGPAG